MKKDEIIQTLRSEAEAYTPKPAIDVSAARALPVPEGEVIAASKTRKILVPVLCALLGVLLLLVALFPVFFRENSVTTLVISINPSAEFTLENGKVSKTKPLNRDAVLLLNGQDFTGKTAKEACLTFATLASERNLIGPDGVRIRVSGGKVGKIEKDIHAALDTLFSVGELDDETFNSLLGGYDEDEIEKFGDYLTKQYADKKSEYLQKAKELLASYKGDVETLDLSDRQAIEAFNKKYLLLGEDFLIEEDEDDDFDEIKEDLSEECDEMLKLLERNSEKAFEELFEGFLELLEEGYDD